MGTVCTQLSLEERRRINRWRHAKVPVTDGPHEWLRERVFVASLPLLEGRVQIDAFVVE